MSGAILILVGAVVWLAVAGYFVNKKFPLASVESFPTYVRQLGEPLFALVAGSAISFLIFENGQLTTGEGLLVLFAVTAVAYGLLVVVMRRRN